MYVRPLLALLLATALTAAHADEIRIAVAANFASTAQKIGAEFEKQTGHKISISTGATGKFYAQIINGAPFEVLLAADDETPTRLEKEGHTVPGRRFTYATGKLVLWSPQTTLVDANADILKRGGFDHLAIANPKLAPYGIAAVETMKTLGVHDPLQGRLVMGENIAQTHQFVATGNASLGFVALSQVLKDGRIDGSYWIVPETFHTPIRQDAVLLNKGRDSKAASGFLDFLKGKIARELIVNSGYHP